MTGIGGGKIRTKGLGFFWKFGTKIIKINLGFDAQIISHLLSTN